MVPSPGELSMEGSGGSELSMEGRMCQASLLGAAGHTDLEPGKGVSWEACLGLLSRYVDLWGRAHCDVALETMT